MYKKIRHNFFLRLLIAAQVGIFYRYLGRGHTYYRLQFILFISIL